MILWRSNPETQQIEKILKKNTTPAKSIQMWPGYLSIEN